jgi:hypothetical protein
MAIGIGNESYNMICVGSDVDYYRYKYRDYEEQLDGSKINVSFVSPVFSVYERFRFCLLKSSNVLQMKPEWKYRPDYVSYEFYKTTAWWQLILWINDVNSIEYFTSETITVPTLDAVTMLQNECYTAGTYIDINEDEKHTKTTSTLFRPAINKLYVEDKFKNITLSDLVSEPNIKTQQCLETFNMSIPILRLRYIDLKNVPVLSSIKLIVDLTTHTLIRDKHYTIVEGIGGRMNRLTWDPKITNNACLLYKLKENNKLTVKYATSI